LHRVAERAPKTQEFQPYDDRATSAINTTKFLPERRNGSIVKSIWMIFGLVVGALATPLAHATTVVSSRPIVFVHGFNPFAIGEDCKTDWTKMKGALAEQGFTGPMTSVSYYSNDIDCDLKIFSGNIFTPIADISHAFAWYVYNTYSSKGVDIDIVAHSMGGLVVRYAMYRTAVGDSTYPPFLRVPHAATLAVPYEGYSLVAEFCHLVAMNTECDEMAPYSGFIADLKNPQALVPQGLGGTLWSGVGSNAEVIEQSDGFVGSSSATSMEIPAAAKHVLPWYKLIFHTMYTHDAQVIGWVANSLSLTQYQGSVADAQAETAANPNPGSAVNLSKLPSSQLPGEIQPNMVNGVQEGVQFSNILQGGLFDKMGIQNGDIVRGCASANVNTPFSALESLETSGQPVTLTFCIVRNGSTLTQTTTVQ
jgi:hypothetical protein